MHAYTDTLVERQEVLLVLGTVQLNYNFTHARDSTHGITQFLRVKCQNLPWNLFFHETRLRVHPRDEIGVSMRRGRGQTLMEKPTRNLP